MPRKLDYTEEAIDDLDAIRRWLTQPGAGSRARHELATIRADSRRLQQSPCLYPIGQHLGVRELPCAGGYRALYQIRPDTGRNDTAGDLLVVRVYGPGQDRGTL